MSPISSLGDGSHGKLILQCIGVCNPQSEDTPQTVAAKIYKMSRVVLEQADIIQFEKYLFELIHHYPTTTIEFPVISIKNEQVKLSCGHIATKKLWV